MGTRGVFLIGESLYTRLIHTKYCIGKNHNHYTERYISVWSSVNTVVALGIRANELYSTYICG
jgi:hypothetical protein